MELNDLLHVLSVRSELRDHRFFVGRRRTLNRFSALADGRVVAWLHGPRRIGKSSLAAEMARRAESRGARTSWIDASRGSGGLEPLLRSALVQLGEPTGGGSVRKRFERMADSTRSKSPVVIVFDEFDRVAPELDLNDQALLRSMTTDRRRVSYVFVTREDPVRYVEEVTEVSSRLLGVAIVESVGMLELADVESLFAVWSTASGREELGGLGRRAYEMVGGFSQGLVMLGHELALTCCDDHRVPLSIDDARARCGSALMSELALFWRDLRPGTREALLSGGPANPDASVDGFVRAEEVWRPELLLEVGRRAPDVPVQPAVANPFGRAQRLLETVAAVNSTVKLNRQVQWFVPTDAAYQTFVLCRECRDQEAFGAVIDVLFKLLYEGARRVDKTMPPESNRQRWRIPDDVRGPFTSSVGMKALTTLRKHYRHDADWNREIDNINDRYADVGKAFDALCGVAAPHTPEHWRACQLNLLRELGDAVSNLLGAVRTWDGME